MCLESPEISPSQTRTSYGIPFIPFHRIEKDPTLSLAIVTDSTSDLPQDIREKYNIYQIPALIIINGEMAHDGVDISREKYYQKLPFFDQLPTTSSPSSGEFQALYKKILSEGYSEILSIHVASELSGIYNAARLAAEEFGPQVKTFDSGQISLGLGFQALEAAKAARNNSPIKEMIALLKALQEKIYVYAMLDTVNYVMRSGRIPWAKAKLGALLNLRPLIQLKNGQVFNTGISRTRKRAISRLHQKIQELGALEYLAVLHTNAEEEGARFLACYDHALQHPPFLVHVTTSIGTHVGPKGIGFAAVVK